MKADIKNISLKYRGKIKKLITLVRYHRSTLGNINHIYSKLTGDEKKKIIQIINDIDTTKKIDDSGKKFLTKTEKSFFSAYYDYKSTKLERFDKLKKYLELSDSSLMVNSENSLKKIDEKFSWAHSPRRFKFTFSNSGHKEISYRHSLHNQREGSFFHNYHDSLKFLDINMEIKNSQVTIKQFDLLSYLSVSDFNTLTKKLTYDFSIFYENIHVDRLSREAFSLDIGLGISKIMKVSKFGALGISSISRNNKKINVEVGGRVFFFYPTSLNKQFDINLEYKRNIMGGHVRYFKSSIGWIYKIVRDLSVGMEVNTLSLNRKNKTRYKAALYLYF